jgi:hypothetical protein
MDDIGQNAAIDRTLPYQKNVPAETSPNPTTREISGLANKNARIIWSMLNTGGDFNLGQQVNAA